MVDSIEFDWILLRFVCVVLFERIFSFPLYVCCVHLFIISRVYIYTCVCVLPFVFNFPCRLYLAARLFWVISSQREELQLRGAQQCAPLSVWKVLQGIGADKGVQMLSLMTGHYPFYSFSKRKEKIRPPRCSTNSIKFQKEKRPDRIVEASLSVTGR